MVGVECVRGGKGLQGLGLMKDLKEPHAMLSF